MGTRVKTLLRIQALVASTAVMVVVACEDAEPESAAEPEPQTQAAPEPEPEPEPDLGPPRRVFAKRFVANVRSTPDPEGRRMGYLRAGATLMTKTSRPVAVDEECDEGWFELGTGGFVCNGKDVIVFDGERLPEVRATQPDPEADLPYQYAYARRDNVAVYRGLPNDEEAAEFEGYVIPGSQPPPPRDGGETPEVQSEDTAEATPAGIGGVEDEASEALASAEGEGEAAEGEEEEEIDAGPPTLRDLRGNRHSILMRRMMKGFYVSLDRDFRAGRRRYWRTQQHEFIPYHMLNLKSGTEFQGLELGPLVSGTETETETETGTETETRRIPKRPRRRTRPRPPSASPSAGSCPATPTATASPTTVACAATHAGPATTTPSTSSARSSNGAIATSWATTAMRIGSGTSRWRSASTGPRTSARTRSGLT